MGAEIGMLVVETIAKIRRAFFVQGKPIKVICRELRLSRKVVRKVLRSKATEFHYEREAQPLPKIGPWSDKLDQLLLANEGKAARERLTLIRLFEELRGLGYGGGYDAVRRYARRWSKERGHSTAAAYVPLSFAPGEAYQFDWSHEVVLLSGVTVTVKAAHVRLCHSRMLFVRVYPRETQEMVFDAHDRAFALVKGTCQRGIYDNMKTAVETILVGKERLYNRRFLQMCSHYLDARGDCRCRRKLRLDQFGAQRRMADTAQSAGMSAARLLRQILWRSGISAVGSAPRLMSSVTSSRPAG
jgi:transposase